MTKDGTKPKQVRVYLNAENESLLRELSAHVSELSESQIVTVLITAALRACVASGNRIPLPLKFTVSEGLEDYRTPEKGVPKARR